ncbi:tRNA-dihydrouridine synthase 2 [Angomonas deanei]|nr:tRNA-dihydrouridine synthase 2 [Angomonas deanei]EPY42534.1 tRNA-dihydrouridine synthase 2 [Angomonas deanei]|eukprot:EPY26466.1 tRNA-dihydrouridine synthase 2 [Angomonas deanei]
MTSSLFDGKVLLAPMVRVCGLGFRQMCLDHGADIVFSEEVVAAKLCKAHAEVVPYPTVGEVTDYVVYEPFKTGYKRAVVFSTCASCPTIIQLGVSDPAVGAAAALVCCENVLGIDINMGCPKKFSVMNGFGAALMRDPVRAGHILRAIHLAVNRAELVHARKDKRTIPISFKTRLQRTAGATVAMLGEILAAAGHTASTPVVHAITLHAREPDSRPDDAPLYTRAEEVVRLCRADERFQSICFVLNGSLESRADAMDKQKQFGFGAGMLARAALVDPRVFSVSPAEGPLFDVMRDLLLYALRYRNPFKNFKYHLTRAFPHHEELRPMMEKVQLQVKHYKDSITFFNITASEVVGLNLEDNEAVVVDTVPDGVPSAPVVLKRGRVEE